MKASTQVEQEKLIISFEGEIDEESDFSTIQTKGHKEIIVDFDKVALINSLGLRSWTFWIKSLPRDSRLIYKRCRRIIVDQMNILQGFVRPGSVIESFYVPYYCEKCKHEEERLAQRHQDFSQGTVDAPEEIRLPEVTTCPNCGGEFSRDVLSGKYFRFLKHRR